MLADSMFLRRAVPACTAVVLLLMSATVARADNRLIPFQARVVDGSNPPVAITGNRVVVFSIYADASSTSACWTEEHPSVPIADGQLNVLLGTIRSLDLPNTCSPGGMAPGPVNFDAPRYLGIKIGAVTNAELVPRHQLVPSFHARTSDQATLAKAVEDNIVRTASIQGDAVTTAKIKDGEIKTADIDNLQVTNQKIADGAVSASKLDASAQTQLTSPFEAHAYVNLQGDHTLDPTGGQHLPIARANVGLSIDAGPAGSLLLPCSGAPPAPAGSDPCGSQDGAVGVGFTPPLPGLYEVCVDFYSSMCLAVETPAGRPSANIDVQWSIDKVASGTLAGAGDGRRRFQSMVLDNQSAPGGRIFHCTQTPVMFCNAFSLTGGTQQVFALRYRYNGPAFPLGGTCTPQGGCSIGIGQNVYVKVREMR